MKPDAYLTALTGGVLNGRTNPDGTACLWVGQGSEAHALYWPFGYSAGGNPLTVYDGSGRAVATVGQHVSLGGGLMPDDVHSIFGCNGFTSFWIVGIIEEPLSNLSQGG